MTFQVLSDLHLEAPKAYDMFEIEPKAPYLALLGDIGNVVAHKDDFLGFLTRQLRQFRAVLFVPGNHEAYHSSWPKTLDALAAFQKDVRRDKSLGEFVLLNRGMFRPPGCNTVVLGCSLFSSVPSASHIAVSLGLNDFFQTDEWDVNKYNAAHARDLAWLNARVAELEGSDDVERIVIFSHWSPTVDARSVDPRHASSPISSGFSTDLSGERCFRSHKVRVWAFGHSHYNCDFKVERGDGARPLRLLANQRGYYFAQSTAFDVEKTVEV